MTDTEYKYWVVRPANPSLWRLWFPPAKLDDSRKVAGPFSTMEDARTAKAAIQRYTLAQYHVEGWKIDE